MIMKFHRVFGRSLDPSKSWYAVSLELKEGRIREYLNNEVCKVFSSEFSEVEIDLLVDSVGQRPPYEWFGSTRKRARVVVATTFGLLSRSLRSKNLKDDFIRSAIFSRIVSRINDVSMEEKLAGSNLTPARAIITIRRHQLQI